MIKIKFQWLKNYIELEEQIIYLKWNINKSKKELFRWVEGDLADVSLTKDSDGSKLEKVIEELEEQLIEQQQLKESLVVVVDTFKGIEHKILKLKYIEGRSLESVAEELSYSSGYIRQKHAELRRRLEFLEEYEEHQNRYNQMK